MLNYCAGKTSNYACVPPPDRGAHTTRKVVGGPEKSGGLGVPADSVEPRH